MLEAGAVDVLQADATRCGGITGFLARRRARARRTTLPLSGALRAVAARPRLLRASPTLRHLEYFHDHVRIERMLFDGVARARATARCGPTASRPGLGLEFKRADAAAVRGLTERDRRCDRDDGSQTQTRVDAVDVDAAARAELAAAIDGEVRFDAGSRALYATDGSNYRQVPIGVVVPRDARRRRRDRRGLPRSTARRCSSRGGGTSLAGQCCNVAVVIDFSKYLQPRSLEIDPERRSSRASQPGIVLDDLRDAAEQHGLTFGPDPATHTHCTLGGMIGNNSCGVHSVMAGKTVDNIDELEVLTYDGVRMRVGPTSERRARARSSRAGGRRGEIYARLQRPARPLRRRDPRALSRRSRAASPATTSTSCCPRTASTSRARWSAPRARCVTVLEATVRLVHSPPARSLLVLGYPDVYRAADHVPRGARAQARSGSKGIDDVLVDDMKTKGTARRRPRRCCPTGDGWLLVEFGGETQGGGRRPGARAAWTRSSKRERRADA